MADSNGGQIGIALLGSMSVFSIWSAVNPSFFTIKHFNEGDHESNKNIRFGMNVGLVLSLVLALALKLAYGKKGMWPAVFSGLTGAGLWISYDQILKKHQS